jgi:phenylpropionate dioxygenase-like ring-hydroxylating dioxygenase large terminal subunit
MFVYNAWYVAGMSADVKAQAPLARLLLCRPVVLFRTADGRVAALDDRCCHRLAPLSYGMVETDGLRCRYHGLKFDAQGRCIEIPGQDDIPKTMCVRPYPVVERHGIVWIWMGDAALADDSQIVDCHWNDDPDWPTARGYLHYKANYQLIVDNLLDFSHLTFLHTATLANKKFAETRPEITPFERGLRLRRSILGEPASPLHAMGGKFTGPVDFWTWQQWWLPTVFDNWAGSAPPGGEVPSENRKDAFQLHHFSLLTPETERSTHYFWTQSCQFPHRELGLIEQIGNGIATAFEEDRWMIEAQQKVVDAEPTQKMQGTRSDFALNQVRFMLNRLVERERVKPTEIPRG